MKVYSTKADIMSKKAPRIMHRAHRRIHSSAEGGWSRIMNANVRLQERLRRH